MRPLETPSLRPLNLEFPRLAGGSPNPSGRWADVPPLRLPLRTGPELVRALLDGESEVQLVEMLLLLEHLRFGGPQQELSRGAFPRSLARLWNQRRELAALTVAWLLPLRLGDEEPGPTLSAISSTAPAPIGVLLGPAPFRGLAEACRAKRSSPAAFARSLGANVSPQVVHRIAWEVVEVVARGGKPSRGDQVLVRDALTVVAPGDFHERVATVLTSLPAPTSSNTQLPSFLRDRIDDGVLRRELLTPDAIRALPEWLGRLTFKEFERSASRLAEVFDDRESLRGSNAGGQLLSRLAFWSNYSTRFLRFRLFLPSDLAGLAEVENALGRQREGVGRSLACSQDAVELAVFLFPSHIVVEPLVERLETRVLHRSPELERRLFDSGGSLTIAEVRVLGGTALDHLYFWQYYCWKTLYELGIEPNADLRQFTMYAVRDRRRFTRPLNKKGRLSPPSNKQQKERDRAMKTWQQRLADSEREAARWMRSNGQTRR